MKLHTFIGLAAVMVLVVAGCEKEGITTKPKLIFKSVTSTHLEYNQDIAFTFEFSDKEGDFNDSIRVVKASSSPCDLASYADSVSWRLPDVSNQKNRVGELEIKMTYQIDLATQPCDGTDTLETVIFKFLISDLAGNRSDTAYSPPITIVKQ